MEDLHYLETLLAEIVNRERLQPGDRLPAERQLAKQMLISRNTLRGLLRTLQAQGKVSTRRGSGTYLRVSLADSITQNNLPEQQVADQMEAAFLFLPIVIQRALTTISAPRLKELQISNITLSQALYARDAERVWNEIRRFFLIIAQETGNRFLVNTVERIFAVEPSLVEHLFQVDRNIREEIFAGHVGMIQALRDRNKSIIPDVSKKYLINLCYVFENSDAAPVWDRIVDLTYQEKNKSIVTEKQRGNQSMPVTES